MPNFELWHSCRKWAISVIFILLLSEETGRNFAGNIDIVCIVKNFIFLTLNVKCFLRCFKDRYLRN